MHILIKNKLFAINWSWFFLFLSTIVCFYVVNTPASKTIVLFKLFSVGQSRELLFLFGLIIFIWALKDSLYNLFYKIFAYATLRKTILLFISLLLLVSTLQLSSMGLEYGRLSNMPFMQEQGYYYRRLLIPALAYFLQFRGEFLYNIFHFLILGSGLYLFVYWLDVKINANLKYWQFISILTSGYFIFNFQFPGYPEIMVAVLSLLILLTEFNLKNKLIIFVLMLLTHESAALFMGLPVLIYTSNRKEIKGYLAIIIIYLFFWVSAYDFNFKQLLLGHTQLGEKNNLDYFFANPFWVMLGVFSAYKLLWLIYFIFIYLIHKTKEYNYFYSISAMVLLPLLLVVIVDVSRIVAWGYLGIVLSTCYCLRFFENKNYLNMLLIGNLLLPSIYVGTNTGPVSFLGIYGLVVDFIKFFII